MSRGFYHSAENIYHTSRLYLKISARLPFISQSIRLFNRCSGVMLPSPRAKVILVSPSCICLTAVSSSNPSRAPQSRLTLRYSPAAMLTATWMSPSGTSAWLVSFLIRQDTSLMIYSKNGSSAAPDRPKASSNRIKSSCKGVHQPSLAIRRL